MTEYAGWFIDIRAGNALISAEAGVGSIPSGARGTQIIRFGAPADRRIDSQPFDHNGGSWPPLELTVGDFSRSARM